MNKKSYLIEKAEKWIDDTAIFKTDCRIFKCTDQKHEIYRKWYLFGRAADKSDDRTVRR